MSGDERSRDLAWLAVGFRVENSQRVAAFLKHLAVCFASFQTVEAGNYGSFDRLFFAQFGEYKGGISGLAECERQFFVFDDLG